VQLLGVVMVVSVIPVLFPNNNSATEPYWNLPKPQAEIVFGCGVALVAVVSVFGLMFPSLISGSYLHAVGKRNIARRRDAIVQPGPDSVWVDIIPRKNWNRMMLENASDIGFLRVDTARREILFEGDRERYRIPADALISCELVKTHYTPTAPPNAPGFWLVLVRAAGPDGVWEAPIAPRLYKRRATTKARLLVAEALQKKIKHMMPKSPALSEETASDQGSSL